MRVVFAGGGTGGHVYPAIAIAQEFLKQDTQTRVLFVGTKHGVEVKVCKQEGFELSTIRSQGFMGMNPLKKIVAMATLLLGIVDSLKILMSFSPDLVFGMGGYASAPMVAAALLTGKKVVLFEPNVVPGLVNKMFAPFASLVLVSFEQTLSYLTNGKVIGQPVRSDIAEIEYKGVQPLKILIFGGSRGASSINNAVTGALAHLKGLQLSIVHQTGSNDYESVVEEYRKYDFEADVKEYIFDMTAEYRDTSLVICRSGATTVAEVTSAGIPSIMVPYPYAIYDHQYKNAMALKNLGAAVVIKDQELTGKKMADTIKNLVSDEVTLVNMSKSAGSMSSKNAAHNIYTCCVDLL